MMFSKLSECCEFIKDGTHTSPIRVREGIPVLSASHVVNGHLNFNTDRFTTEEELRLFRQRLNPQIGDVLLTIVGTIGRVAILTENRPLVFQRSVCVFRPQKTLLNSLYLRYVLESNDVKLQLDHETHEVAQAGVYLEPLNKIEIPLPSLPEQKRIAAILAKADRLCRLRRYALELSGGYLQAVFLEMFGSWNYPLYLLQELSKDERGAFVNGPFGSNLLTNELTSSGIPVIYIRDIASQVYRRVSLVCVTEQKAKELNVYKVLPGDVLVAKVGDPPGTAAIYPASQPMGIITQDVIRIRVKRSLVTPEYLSAFLNSRKGYHTLEPIIVEGTRSRFGLTPYKELHIPVPPLTLQHDFANIVRLGDRLRSQQREALRQAEHLFQALLHQAFEGELEERVMEDVEAMGQDIGYYVPYEEDAVHRPVKMVAEETAQLSLPLE